MQLRLIKTVALVLAMIGSLSLAARAETTGSLSGRIQSEDGHPIERALVIAQGKGKTVANAAPISGRSAADGSFSLPGLTPGDYQVCVYDAAKEYLDPCRWSTSPPAAHITANSDYHMPPIALRKGRLLRVRITDEAGVVAADKSGPKLLVGLWQDNGLFVTVPLNSTDSKGRIHALYIPQGHCQVCVAW